MKPKLPVSGFLTLLAPTAACMLTSCDCSFFGIPSDSCPEENIGAEAPASATLAAETLAESKAGTPDEPTRLTPLPAASSGILAFAVAAPDVEFLVTTERRLQVTFLDEADILSHLPGEQMTVRIVDQSPQIELAFSMDGRVLTSNHPLPDGNDQRLAVTYNGLSDTVDVLPPLNQWKPVGDDSTITAFR